jgi:hypothetical protein
LSNNPTIAPLAAPEAAALTVQGTLNFAETVSPYGDRLSKLRSFLRLMPSPFATTTVPLLTDSALTAKRLITSCSS